MKEKTPGRFDLGAIDQIGYVVHDMQTSLPLYEALYGPFETLDAPMEAALYRGRSVDCRLALAMNRAGPIEIELIEVVEGETPHTEHLRKHGEGLHHVRFRVSAIDQRIAAMEAAGYRNIFYKRWAPDLAFSYLESPGALDGQIIELLEMP